MTTLHDETAFDASENDLKGATLTVTQSGEFWFVPSNDYDGKVYFESSPDGGSTWFETQVHDLSAGGYGLRSVYPAAGRLYRTDVIGLFRTRMEGGSRGSLSAYGTAVSSGGGGGSVTIDDGDDAALGATTDAAATTTGGTFSLISLVKGLFGAIGLAADAVVAAGAAGSINAKLRAISRDLVANIVLATGSNIIGRVGIDQTTPGTTDHVTAETKAYTAPASGELAGSATAVQMPSVPCKLIRFKAENDNAGRVYIGVSSSVTKKDGTTDTTTGLELSPGEDTGWIPVDNANRFWRICDNAGDDLTYLALA